MSTKQVEVKIEELVERIAQLEKIVAELSTKLEKPTNAAAREMTDADALRIMTGDLKDKKHNDAAKELGLSYGQVYSCRGEYTFKHIHKQLKATEGYKNPFIK